MSFISKKHMQAGDYVNYALLTLVALICLLPFVYVFAVSFTDPDVYIPLQVTLFPKKWSLASYRFILSTPTFMNATQNNIFITVVGTILNLLVTFTFAYGLSKKALPGRKFFMSMTIAAMLVNAGIVPNYLLMKNLGLINSLWALILATLTSSWNVMVVKSFMNGIPDSLEEAAKIDGCNEIGIFARIIIPLSIPCLASFTLLFAVAHWNTYFNAMLYISSPKKWTLQVLVKTLIVDSDSQGVGQGSASESVSVPQETIRMASVMLAMAPILVLYPFLQRYFVSGMTLGALKE